MPFVKANVPSTLERLAKIIQFVRFPIRTISQAQLDPGQHNRSRPAENHGPSVQIVRAEIVVKTGGTSHENLYERAEGAGLKILEKVVRPTNGDRQGCMP